VCALLIAVMAARSVIKCISQRTVIEAVVNMVCLYFGPESETQLWFAFRNVQCLQLKDGLGFCNSHTL